MRDTRIEVQLKEALQAALLALYNISEGEGQITLQPTRKEFQGQYTFVVFPFLKLAKQKPEQLASNLGEYLQSNTEIVANYNVVKGFLNIEISNGGWFSAFKEILATTNLGRATRNKQKVMVEFSSPNTNKPLHLGHLRNNFLGDSVSKILEYAGYEVMKTNLVNDRGIHICKSMLAYQKFGNDETPESSGLKGDHLIGKYYVKFDQAYKEEIKQLEQEGIDREIAKKQAPLLLEAQQLLQQWEEGEKGTVALWEKMNGWVYDGFEVTYQTMGIAFDKIYKESETYLLGKDIVDEGLEKGVFFKKDDGSVWVDLAEEGLDEKLVLRADGTAVYMTQDMGTCDFKYSDFPFNQSVYTVGNEQDYHFKVLFAIMKKLGRPYAEGLYHLSYGMVDLPTGKMKSREGTVVDADDLMQEMFNTAEKQTHELGKIDGLSENEAQTLYHQLGLGAIKYFLLKVDPKKRLLFNPQESIEFQGNTGPFIQYTHARISAILRRAKSSDVKSGISSSVKFEEKEIELIYLLSQFPKVVQIAAESYSPASIAQYVYDLAKAYNGFYQDLPIFSTSDLTGTASRIALSQKTAEVIKSATGLLGIEVPERM